MPPGHFFSQYIFPASNFQDVIDTIIDGVISTMLDFLGEIPIVGQAAEQLAVFLSDIRDLLDPIVAAVDALFTVFNVDPSDPSSVTGFFGPLQPIFDMLTTALGRRYHSRLYAGFSPNRFVDTAFR